MTCSRNVGKEKYSQNFVRLEITSKYSFKTRDNTEICFQEIKCKCTDPVEVDQVRVWRWRRLNKTNTWFSLIPCIGPV